MLDNDQQTIPDRLRSLEPTTNAGDTYHVEPVHRPYEPPVEEPQDRDHDNDADSRYTEDADGFEPRDEDDAAGVEPVYPEDETSPDESNSDRESGPFAAIPRPALRKDISVSYAVSLLAATGVLSLATWLGPVPWPVSLSLILLLASSLVEGWGRVTAIGALVAGVVMAVSFLPSFDDTPPAAPTAVVTTPPAEPPEPVAGSLGIHMDKLTDSWNTVTGPPQITRGLTRHNETGEYDTFIYRFGEWGRVAGAYDPADEAIYALLVAGQFSGPATDQLYMHLCFVVAPYSQECIDSYNQHGLDGGSLEDFDGIAHTAEWSVEDHTWRLQIEGNVLTIRVYGADAAP